MRFLLFFICFSMQLLANSQPLQYGLYWTNTAKKNLIPSFSGDDYSLLNSYGFGAAIKIVKQNNDDEKSIYFQQHIGYWKDNLTYKTNIENLNVGVAVSSFQVQSLLGIPTTIDKLDLQFGLGANISLDRSYYQCGRSVLNTSLFLIGADSLVGNTILPQVSIGANYQASKKMNFQFFINQTLLNYLDKNVRVIYTQIQPAITKKISFMPTAIGVCANYFFNQ
jgi:hypothetical protein